MSKQKASAECGNTQALSTKHQDSVGSADNNIYLPVYKINRDSWQMFIPVEPGINSRRIIDQAIHMLRTIKASGFPRPVQVNFHSDRTIVACGKKFAVEKELPLEFGRKLRVEMGSTGVDYVSIFLDSHPLSSPIITFGRNGIGEFLAYINLLGGE